jgi:hypothetical protein
MNFGIAKNRGPVDIKDVHGKFLANLNCLVVDLLKIILKKRRLDLFRKGDQFGLSYQD